MDGDIVFYIHGDTIEYGGELFSAGELTADILNLSLEDYQRIQKKRPAHEKPYGAVRAHPGPGILAEAQLPVHGSAYADDGVSGISDPASG